MNHVYLIGYLGRHAEPASNGTCAYTRLSLATRRPIPEANGQTFADYTDWIYATQFGESSVTRHLTTGKPVRILGHLHNYTGPDAQGHPVTRTNVIVDSLQMIDGAGRTKNQTTLIGRLGRDAELFYTRKGIPYAKMSVATSRGWSNRETGEWVEETTWVRVFLPNHENVFEFLTKGKQIEVQGRLRSVSYSTKRGTTIYTTELVAKEIILLTKKPVTPVSKKQQMNRRAHARSCR